MWPTNWHSCHCECVSVCARPLCKQGQDSKAREGESRREGGAGAGTEGGVSRCQKAVALQIMRSICRRISRADKASKRERQRQSEGERERASETLTLSLHNFHNFRLEGSPRCGTDLASAQGQRAVGRGGGAEAEGWTVSAWPCHNDKHAAIDAIIVCP